MSLFLNGKSMEPTGFDLIHLEEVTARAVSDNDIKIDIGAPEVAGYTFRTWLQPRSQGFVASGYIEPATQPSASIWIPDTQKQLIHAGAPFAAVALYTKD